MRTDVKRNRARAKFALALSLLAAAAAVVVLWDRGRPVAGVGLAALLAVAGAWEYRRKLSDLRTAARAEREAEEQRDRQ